VEGAPSLSSFGWCHGSDNGVIYILGGSDGFCLQSSFWKVDFVAGKAQHINEYDSAVTGNKMLCVFERGNDVIYSIGGNNSDGISYKVLMNNSSEWVPLEKQYSILFSNPEALPDRKFMFSSAVHLR
jgi:hypothetical protein